MKSGDAGEPTAVFFKFLHVAFAVGGANDEGVITRCGGRPFRLPKRPRKIATGLINIGVMPRFFIIETDLDSRDAAVATVSHALDLNWSVQFA